MAPYSMDASNLGFDEQNIFGQLAPYGTKTQGP